MRDGNILGEEYSRGCKKVELGLGLEPEFDTRRVEGEGEVVEGLCLTVGQEGLDCTDRSMRDYIGVRRGDGLMRWVGIVNSLMHDQAGD